MAGPIEAASIEKTEAFNSYNLGWKEPIVPVYISMGS